ncbi:MAG: ribbon-helix-helix protein, CopG family [Spirochaetes bacterium]|nr:ribbon-helix-helix protein, CopG family [Spirochaetota bacterium]
MQTVQMTLEPDLVMRIDRKSKKLGMSRSALTRVALEEYLAKKNTVEKEKQHRKGYSESRSTRDLTGWENEQVWPQ